LEAGRQKVRFKWGEVVEKKGGERVIEQKKAQC